MGEEVKDEKELTHIDLFSGIGGFTLAAEWAGFRTVVFCEKEKFCQKVLKKRFRAVIADSKSMGRRNGITEDKRKKSRKIDSFSNQAPLLIPEIRDFDGTKYRGATLLTGGFPCQPFSVAGPQRGKEDDRYLWPEMLRVIDEAKPRWILAENVPGIFRMALDTVLADLEGKGYTTGTVIIPACGLNAPHRRNRVWIVAHTRLSRQTKHEKQAARIEQSNQNAPDSERWRCKRRGQEQMGKGGKVANGAKRANSNASHSNSGRIRLYDSGGIKEGSTSRDVWEESWHEVAARFCRVDDGISDRIHRLKALGNAIVPQIAFEILRYIGEIERGNL